MKHLKLFENVTDECWIVIGEDLDDATNNHHDLFDNKESAENFFIKMINDEKRLFFERNQHWKKKQHYSTSFRSETTFSSEDLILTISEANKWAEDNSSDYKWYYYKTNIQSNYELPDYLKKAIEEKKYNL